jgi:Flp pilus assembly protein TadG
MSIRTRFGSRVAGSLGQARGNTLIEFAIISTLFILLSMGTLEFGRAVWAYNSLSQAAREGSRFAIVRGGDSGRAATGVQVGDYVRSRVSSFTPLTVTTSWQPDNKPGSLVRVQVQYTFSPVVPLFPSIPLTSTSQMVIAF